MLQNIAPLFILKFCRKAHLFLGRTTRKYSPLMLNSQVDCWWLLPKVNNFPRANFCVEWGINTTLYASVWGRTLWPCYSDIIYVTSPDNCWLYLFLSAAAFFCLPVILWCICQCRQCPITVIVTQLSVSDEKKRVTALTSHQSSLWKIDIVLPSKQQLKNRPALPVRPWTISFH